MSNAQNTATMTINFNLRFDISSTVFIANAHHNYISHDDANNFIDFVYGNLDQVTPDDVERFVKKYAPIGSQANLAEFIMNHLLMCHNITVEEADRRFC